VIPKPKLVRVIEPVAIKDNASWTSQEIDCAGFDFAIVFFQLGASDVAMAALKLTECDTTGGSFTDITGTVFGTAVDIDGTTTALPGTTDDNKFEAWYVDLRKRKRFMKVVATAGDGSTGTYGIAVALLFRPEETPNTSAELGCEHVVEL
jgi:hypothetical protein